MHGGGQGFDSPRLHTSLRERSAGRLLVRRQAPRPRRRRPAAAAALAVVTTTQPTQPSIPHHHRSPDAQRSQADCPYLPAADVAAAQRPESGLGARRPGSRPAGVHVHRDRRPGAAHGVGAAGEQPGAGEGRGRPRGARRLDRPRRSAGRVDWVGGAGTVAASSAARSTPSALGRSSAVVVTTNQAQSLKAENGWLRRSSPRWACPDPSCIQRARCTGPAGPAVHRARWMPLTGVAQTAGCVGGGSSTRGGCAAGGGGRPGRSTTTSRTPPAPTRPSATERPRPPASRRARRGDHLRPATADGACKVSAAEQLRAAARQRRAPRTQQPGTDPHRAGGRTRHRTLPGVADDVPHAHVFVRQPGPSLVLVPCALASTAAPCRSVPMRVRSSSCLAAPSPPRRRPAPVAGWVG